jgi:hypothetical protein
MRTETIVAPTKRMNITLPGDLLHELYALIPPRKRNQFIVELLERELRRQRLLKVLEETSGAWSEEDYPHLKTRDDIDHYVRQLREQWTAPSEDEMVEHAEANGSVSARHQSADPRAAR